jgi:hypothetical protein
MVTYATSASSSAASASAARHYLCLTQHLQALGGGGMAELELFAELPGGKWLPGEDDEQLPTDRIR